MTKQQKVKTSTIIALALLAIIGFVYWWQNAKDTGPLGKLWKLISGGKVKPSAVEIKVIDNETGKETVVSPVGEDFLTPEGESSMNAKLGSATSSGSSNYTVVATLNNQIIDSTEITGGGNTAKTAGGDCKCSGDCSAFPGTSSAGCVYKDGQCLTKCENSTTGSVYYAGGKTATASPVFL